MVLKEDLFKSRLTLTENLKIDKSPNNNSRFSLAFHEKGKKEEETTRLTCKPEFLPLASPPGRQVAATDRVPKWRPEGFRSWSPPGGKVIHRCPWWRCSGDPSTTSAFFGLGTTQPWQIRHVSDPSWETDPTARGCVPLKTPQSFIKFYMRVWITPQRSEIKGGWVESLALFSFRVLI